MAAILQDGKILTREQLEVAILTHPEMIYFGPGLQITSNQFVGVRSVGSGIILEKSPAHHGMSDLLKGILGARRTSQEADLNVRYEDPLGRMRDDCSDTFHGDTTKSKTAVNCSTVSTKCRMGHNPAQELQRRDDLYQPGAILKVNGPEGDLHTWEFVWKEGKAGGSLRRLKFVTNESGYKLIQEKLDAWISASHTSMAMNEAAKAALDACGGHLKENPGHQHDSDNLVRVKHIDGEAVDCIDRYDTSFIIGRETDAKLDDQTYPQKEYVINMRSIQLQGKTRPNCDSSSSIFNNSHIIVVAAVLPVRFRNCNWTLLYSTSRDGISLNTLYRKIHLKGPTILVIRDWEKNIFGCYASDEWRVNGRSYGNGECFVFQLAPDMKAYKWTRENHIFMFSNLDMLAIGGGDHYSILLNSDLLTGYSGTCETFGSPSLARSEEFTVSAVEVWGFQ